MKNNLKFKHFKFYEDLLWNGNHVERSPISVFNIQIHFTTQLLTVSILFNIFGKELSSMINLYTYIYKITSNSQMYKQICAHDWEMVTITDLSSSQSTPAISSHHDMFKSWCKFQLENVKPIIS